MTDRYTDEVLQLEGAERLVLPISRLVVDPERFRDDVDEPRPAKGRGAVYISTNNGRPLKAVADREELIRRYDDPHHAHLDALAERSLAEHGATLLIDLGKLWSCAILYDRGLMVYFPNALGGRGPRG